MAKSEAQGGYFSRVVVSQSLLAQIDATNRKPKRRFLLGLGEPFEPNPWDISDSEDDEKDFSDGVLNGRIRTCPVETTVIIVC